MISLKSFSIKDLVDILKKTVVRFPFTVFAILALSFLLVGYVHEWIKHVRPGVWFFLIYTVLVSTASALALEKKENKTAGIMIQLGLIVLLAVYTLFFLPEKLFDIQIGQHVVFGVMLVLLLPVSASLKRGMEVSFWEFTWKSIVRLAISYLFSSVLFAGLLVAVLSLKMLFGMNISEKMNLDIAIFSFLIFGLIYFLTEIPEHPDRLNRFDPVSKFLKFIGLYILLPIVGLYTVILYAYLGKILVEWELPRGWVTWLVSILGLLGMVTMYINAPLRKEGNYKIVEFFYRYFPLLLLPLVILMSIGISKRVGDYGYTYNRLYVIILNVWFYGAAVYLLLSQSRYLRWVLLSFTITGMIFTLGPLNVFDYSKKCVEESVIRDFQDMNVWNEDHVNLPDFKMAANDSLKMEVNSKLKYFRDNYGRESIQIFLPKEATAQDAEELFKISKAGVVSKAQKAFDYTAWVVEDPIDIKAYNKVYTLEMNANDTTDLEVDGVKFKMKSFDVDMTLHSRLYSIDLSSVLENFKNPDQKQLALADATYFQDDIKIIINRVNLRRMDDGSDLVKWLQLRIYTP